ncbi:CsbD family protein [Tomitella fengzijianii]|uniref:CsbD family protein n=1 Tax=Tomitella fengzijianii TaxID=2597660 RepID=A0A516X5H2_9ACTN|nr:CsbD family protein [Tomitella fengzijianii]QDQ98317.1 CsbD family protein [Tomitella fengzijianii]
MSASDKFSNKAEELKGRAKEAAGAAADDEELQEEGRSDQASSQVKKGVEKLKDKADEAAARIVGDD